MSGFSRSDSVPTILLQIRQETHSPSPDDGQAVAEPGATDGPRRAHLQMTFFRCFRRRWNSLQGRGT